MSTQRGQRGEQAARRYLQRHGYHILAQNVRLGRGELDIIASKNEVLAFIEVKYYKKRDDALLAVHRDKRRRLIQAASLWLRQHSEYASACCRFDVMIVTNRRQPWPAMQIEHITDAFRLH